VIECRIQRLHECHRLALAIGCFFRANHQAIARHDLDNALGRCHFYYVKQKRDQADYLVWRFNKGKTSKEIKREVKKGKWKLIEKRHQMSLFENTKRAKQKAAASEPAE
jgi:hypothetical protein